ncbi:hypothetical protein KSC_073850 [Ktedonobacter sp. SOSP1-52]|nr:hypothetical protein KSC_073850 [Ktedonobacter sp. SOSP1-52]
MQWRKEEITHNMRKRLRKGFSDQYYIDTITCKVGPGARLALVSRVCYSISAQPRVLFVLRDSSPGVT